MTKNHYGNTCWQKLDKVRHFWCFRITEITERLCEERWCFVYPTVASFQLESPPTWKQSLTNLHSVALCRSLQLGHDCDKKQHPGYWRSAVIFTYRTTMVEEISKQLVFYQSSLWKLRLLRWSGVSPYQTTEGLVLSTSFNLENKNIHRPVLLQLSSNFEIAPFEQKRREVRLIAVVTMESYNSSSGLLILDQKTSISHEFQDPTLSKTCPAMPDCLLQPWHDTHVVHFNCSRYT